MIQTAADVFFYILALVVVGAALDLAIDLTAHVVGRRVAAGLNERGER